MAEAKQRALIVEDDRAWQEILAEILADVGLEVDVMGDYGSAAAALRACPYRLAIVDLSLSAQTYQNVDGLRVLEAVRAYAPGCTPVLLTGFATVELAVEAITDFGAYTCLRKETFRRAPFRALLWRILAGAPGARGAQSILPSGEDGSDRDGRAPADRDSSPAEPTEADRRVAEQLARLTPREREVLELLVRGLTNKGIASALTISVNTVKRYLKLIFDKLEVNSRAAAVAKAVSAGMK